MATAPSSRCSVADALDPDLLAPATLADPYPVLADLRERSPVHWSARYRAWLLTRYDDCDAAHRDPRFSSNRIAPVLRKLEAEGGSDALIRTLRVLAGWMVFKDGAEHRRLRALVNRAFTPRAVARMHETIERLTDELLDALEGRTEADLVRELAFPLPAIVIAEMLGVAPEDRNRFKSWSEDVASLVFGAVDDERRHERAKSGMAELVAYFHGLIDAAEREPGEDLLAHLVAVRSADGDALTRDELVAMCTLLLFGGHETTTNLLSSGVLALLRHPDQADRLRAAPALARCAVEELLRFDGPARISARVVAEQLELRGQTLHAGERVYLVLAAANRDPERFERPDDLDLGRDPNPHIGFGIGRHYCLGAPLARLEGAIAIPRVFARLRSLRLDDDALAWQPTLLSRSLRALPVRYER
jgi:cytochrome P450